MIAHPQMKARLNEIADNRPAFLASVRNVEECALALRGGAQVIDIKDPSVGALGAASDNEVCAIVQWVAEHTGSSTPVSATVGDLPLDAPTMVKICASRAATGVDIVKVGLLPGAARPDCIQALRIVADKHPVMAVMFADQEAGDPQSLTTTIAQLAEARFLGVMIDTFDKKAGSLSAHWSVAQCTAFTTLVQEHQMVCGLAGSLTLADVPVLAGCGPDVLGFRGALCQASRTSALDLDCVQAVGQRLART